jgi:hypothetical protein
MRKTKGDGAATAVPRELQQLWMHLIREQWTSLAVVPTEPTTSARAVTDALVTMAGFYDFGDLKVMDAQGLSLQEGVKLAQELALTTAKGGRVVVAVDSPFQNAGAIPTILATSAAVLVVRLGSSEIESVRSVVEIIGRERVLGTLAVRGQALTAPLAAAPEGSRVVTVGQKRA